MCTFLQKAILCHRISDVTQQQSLRWWLLLLVITCYMLCITMHLLCLCLFFLLRYSYRSAFFKWFEIAAFQPKKLCSACYSVCNVSIRCPQQSASESYDVLTNTNLYQVLCQFVVVDSGWCFHLLCQRKIEINELTSQQQPALYYAPSSFIHQAVNSSYFLQAFYALIFLHHFPFSEHWRFFIIVSTVHVSFSFYTTKWIYSSFICISLYCSCDAIATSKIEAWHRDFTIFLLIR